MITIKLTIDRSCQTFIGPVCCIFPSCNIFFGNPEHCGSNVLYIFKHNLPKHSDPVLYARESPLNMCLILPTWLYCRLGGSNYYNKVPQYNFVLRTSYMFDVFMQRLSVNKLHNMSDEWSCNNWYISLLINTHLAKGVDKQNQCNCEIKKIRMNTLIALWNVNKGPIDDVK